MMMPVLDQSPVHHHHHHGHGHQTFYHQQHIPENTGKMQLTLILPNGVPSVINVDANTPMMDLLVQATSLNKLNPSGYSLVVLDSNQHVIHFKANQTVGQIVQSCQLPQLNGSSTISLLPKETSPPNSSSKSKTQPFEITVRLQVNLPDGQKILLRIDPTLPLHEIKEQICKQKKYTDSNRYTLRLPNKLHEPLLLGLSLAEYKTNELTLIHLKNDPKINTHQIQSFDRLYCVRSESQSPQEIQNEQQELANSKQTSTTNIQINSNQNQNQNATSLPLTRPTHPITSHTSLHAYWNDPNFDTQSQISNCSSTTKKRRAPKPPGYISPIFNEPIPITELHESHESLTESTNGTKQKRKAPTIPNTNIQQEILPSTNIQQENLTNTNIQQENLPNEIHDNQQERIIIQSEKLNIKIDPVDEQRILNLLAEHETPPSVKLVITTNPPNQNIIEKHSPEQNIPVTHSSTPIYSQIQKIKESTQTESPYSTLKLTPTPPINEQEEIINITPTPIINNQQEEKIINTTPAPPIINKQEEIINTSPVNYSIDEIVQAGIAEPPVKSPLKSPKKLSPNGGLTKIINDHNERAHVYQDNEKQPENVSYFRVAKSRHGKFETDNQGFINNSTNVFESTNNQQQQQQPQPQPQSIKSSETTLRKTNSTVNQQQTKGKQAYDLLKKYEKEDEQVQPIDTDYLKTTTDNKEKSPTPIQLEVTERTTHISVTVESDRKQLITRASPVPQQTSMIPPIVAPKPFGKTITEYRTIKRIGSDGETTTTTTVHTSTVPSDNTYDNNEKKTNTNSHESLMESIRQFGGSENLNKK